MKNKIKGYAVLTTAALASLVLTGCNEAKKIDKLLADGDCSEALDFYEEKTLSDKEEEKLSGKLKERLEETLKNYAAGEVKYKTAQKLVETIVKMDLDAISDETADAVARLATINASKNAFDSAEASAEQGNKLSAYKLYSQVISEDCNYEKAQSEMVKIKQEYVEELSKKADEYIANGGYSNAIYLIKDAFDESGIPELQPELTRVLNAYKQHVFEQADTFMAAEDFYNARNAVNHVINYDYWTEADKTDFQAKLDAVDEAEEICKFNQAKENYKKYINSYFENKNYESAYQLIDELQKNYPERYEADEEFKLYVQGLDDTFYTYIVELAAKYREQSLYAGLKEIYAEAKAVRPMESFDKYFENLLSACPVYLTEAEFVEYSNVTELAVDKDIVKGSDETEYLPCKSRFVMNAAAADSWTSEKVASVTYDLKGEYTSLKGVAGTVDATLENTADPETGAETVTSEEAGKLEFFGNDDTLLLSVDINGTDSAKEISLDVTGVQKLTIKFTVTNGDMGVLMREFVLGKEQIS